MIDNCKRAASRTRVSASAHVLTLSSCPGAAVLLVWSKEHFRFRGIPISDMHVASLNLKQPWKYKD